EFALLLTGDGGWAGLDQELAARLAASGVPTVGLNSLKYFWTERTPQQTARDVARVLRHYFAAWNKRRLLLIGYSFGADVLPFVVNRLPPELRERVASLSLLGIDADASFEVRISDWVGSGGGGAPTRPELAALTHVPVLCVYGEGESDSIRSEEHTSELQSLAYLVCRLLLEKKKTETEFLPTNLPVFAPLWRPLIPVETLHIQIDHHRQFARTAFFDALLEQSHLPSIHLPAA